MLKITLLIIVAALAALLLYAATRPDSFRLERSTSISAPPEKVFALISDLRLFNTWNPFAAMDPAQVISYEATTVGVGAAYSWKGDKSGAGRMEVAELMPAQRVTMKLDFSKPFEAHNRVYFSIQPQANGCHVTWAMSGPNAYVNKLMQVLFSMDKMVGSEFEKGLANLKALAEKT